MQADAASDAAAGQQAASQMANQLQLAMYNNNVALQAPAINTGNAARDRLSFLLGLSGTGFSNSTLPQVNPSSIYSGPSTAFATSQPSTIYGGGGAYSSTQPLSYDQLRAQLLPQFTSSGRGANAPKFDPSTLPMLDRVMYERMTDPKERADFEARHLGTPTSVRSDQGPNPGQYDTLQWQTSPNIDSIDETALDAAIRERLRQQEADAAAREAAARADPAFGSLAQRFQFGTYTPGTFSFTNDDFYRDPSYEFRLQQGQKALDRAGLAAGRFLSGRQLQATSDYNQDAASQEYQNAWTRGLNTFNVNETGRRNAFDTNEQNRFNAYQANFSNTVNPLLSLAGSGQVGAQFLGGAGERTAQIVGNNTTGAANATGAAGIAGANAISSGLTGAANTYQQNQLLNRLFTGGSVNNNPSVNPLWGSGGFFSGNRGSGD
ncbi:hypothetical protein A8M77_15480 [Variovorax sp. JS1663]|nr:hypothetical protein A8M77_15480 [Variovorax sp. JS1663]